MPNDSLFFESEHDVFGQSGNILKLDEESSIILPKTSSINETEYEITYELTTAEKTNYPTGIAKIIYKYNGVNIGNAMLCYSSSNTQSSEESSTSSPIYINVKILFAIAAALVLIMTICGSISTKNIHTRKVVSKSDRIRYNRRKREFRKSNRKNKF